VKFLPAALRDTAPCTSQAMRSPTASLRAMQTIYESATDWNRSHPPGTPVRILLRDGSEREARTRSYALQWGALAVIALDDNSGLFTISALRPVQS
jgi:hypothetical protein